MTQARIIIASHHRITHHHHHSHQQTIDRSLLSAFYISAYNIPGQFIFKVRYKMKSFIASLILAIVCLSAASAFSVRPSVVSTVSGPSSTSLNVFGNRKSKAQKEEEVDSRFWQGEWVCKDCGYIYNRVSSLLFTLLF